MNENITKELNKAFAQVRIMRATEPRQTEGAALPTSVIDTAILPSRLGLLSEAVLTPDESEVGAHLAQTVHATLMEALTLVGAELLAQDDITPEEQEAVLEFASRISRLVERRLEPFFVLLEAGAEGAARALRFEAIEADLALFFAADVDAA